MKLLRTINEQEGIYEIECETKEEAEALIELVKEEYPYAIIHGTGYYSKKYILNLFANWGEQVEIKLAEDGKTTTCINCGDCNDIIRPCRNSSPGMRNDQERCHHEQFWAEVVQEKNIHFVKNGNVYAFTKGEGGFCGARYNVLFEDGEILNNVGLWHRGDVPKTIEHLFRKATTEMR